MRRALTLACVLLWTFEWGEAEAEAGVELLIKPFTGFFAIRTHTATHARTLAELQLCWCDRWQGELHMSAESERKTFLTYDCVWFLFLLSHTTSSFSLTLSLLSLYSLTQSHISHIYFYFHFFYTFFFIFLSSLCICVFVLYVLCFTHCRYVFLLLSPLLACLPAWCCSHFFMWK